MTAGFPRTDLKKKKKKKVRGWEPAREVASPAGVQGPHTRARARAGGRFSPKTPLRAGATQPSAPRGPEAPGSPAGLAAAGPERVSARGRDGLRPGSRLRVGRWCAAARGAGAGGGARARARASSGHQEPRPASAVTRRGQKPEDQAQGVRGFEPPLPPPPLRASLLRRRPPGRPRLRLRLRHQARSQASQSQPAAVCGAFRVSPSPFPPAAPSLPGARRARSLPLGSGRAGGFGLRGGGGGGGEAGERVSARGGSQCLCESPVPGVRATQSERRGARAGAEPGPASAAAPPPAPTPAPGPAAHPPAPRRPSRAPRGRLARGPAPTPDPGARPPAALPPARRRCGARRGMSQRLLGAPSRCRTAAAPGNRDDEPPVRPLRKSRVSHGESQLPG
ncbi:sterile alpha motif domain-containing protein 1-like [Panthera pardus]|uniref:Sterile alpha motif domain-containing protein 1-like n=1 Tax=Panthera pardus TaxID=9691 RepID=A0A9W2UYD4_PANPR|nr:sterile alpha motif domain-containing protein 1-like [Panthera pardus]